MQQQHYSQQQLAQAFPQAQRNVSSSPLQRPLQTQPFTPTQNMGRQYNDDLARNYSTDMRDRRGQVAQHYSQQPQQIDQLVSKISALEKENVSLKRQLEQATNQISILSQKLTQQPTQSLLKTTTFELVVLQKAVEQLEGLKVGLQKKKNMTSNNQTTAVPDSQKEAFSELKSKVDNITVMEEKIQQEQSAVQTMLLFPQDEPRQGRRLQAASDQVDNKTKVSPMKYVNLKAGSSQNALRVSPRRKIEGQQI